MGRRKIGLLLLNLAALLVISGSLYDLLVPAVPANHVRYIGAVNPQAAPRLAELDLAMLRSIGGCLLAVGIASLLLTNGPVRRGDGWARLSVLILIGVAEGNNSYRMYPFGSPWYGPLSFALLAALGVVLVGATGRPGRAVATASNS
jgi:hypothetical protein